MFAAELYKPIFINIVLILNLWAINTCSHIHSRQKTNFVGFVLLFLIIFIGLRPVSDVFTDMPGYADSYRYYFIRNKHGEYTWEFFFELFHDFNFGEEYWFLFIEFGYIGFIWLACKRIFGYEAWFPILFFLSSFTFFNYGTNVLRNGLSLSIVLYGISILMVPISKKEWKNNLCIIFFFFLAFGVHKSSILPAICSLIAFRLNSVKIPFYIWVVCLTVSYFVSGYTEIIFTQLGFDDRLESYLSNNSDRSTGFRFDFLLYSVAPLVIAYYVRKMETMDYLYVKLLNTYLLANSFWLLCIKASFSDRFAQLSWFMYPLLLAYPFMSTKNYSSTKFKRRGLLFFFLFAYTRWLIK